MESKAAKDPHIYISKEGRKLYDNLKEHLDEFKSLENKHFFILAVLFGYLNEKRKPLLNADKTESGFTKTEYLTDEEISVFKAIAISESGNIEMVSDTAKVYSLCAEYANAGMEFIKKFVFEDPASFLKKFGALLKEECK